ncbi:hypothetical protein MMC13_005300 [Lambiella insularis]|nr:hypothetical protein [Lambiella insularis]
MSIPPLPPITTPSPSPYTTITTFLSTHSPQILSLEILPSSHPSILTDGLSLGIPRPALRSAYLTARTIFLSRTSLSASTTSTTNQPSPHALDFATQLLLLHSPEHLSAANHRKAALSHSSPNRPACHAELALLTTLLTSPLPSHAKSPTLWHHRFWLVTHHQPCLLSGPQPPATSTSPPHPGSSAAFLLAELATVLQAAVRHPANYHAFQYARRVLGAWGGAVSGAEVVRRVGGWCLAHPGDVSGWAFLGWVLRAEGVGWEEGERERVRAEVVRRTRGFVEDVGWRGESVEGFLRGVEGEGG